jgi:hypothetical protein
MNGKIISSFAWGLLVAEKAHNKGCLCEAKGLHYNPPICVRGSRTLVHHPGRFCLHLRGTPLGLSHDIPSCWRSSSPDNGKVIYKLTTLQAANFIPMSCAFLATCTHRGGVRSILCFEKVTDFIMRLLSRNISVIINNNLSIFY